MVDKCRTSTFENSALLLLTHEQTNIAHRVTDSLIQNRAFRSFDQYALSQNRLFVPDAE